MFFLWANTNLHCLSQACFTVYTTRFAKSTALNIYGVTNSALTKPWAVTSGAETQRSWTAAQLISIVMTLMLIVFQSATKILLLPLRAARAKGLVRGGCADLIRKGKWASVGVVVLIWIKWIWV